MTDSRGRVRHVDPSSLPKHFDAMEAERRWAARWRELGVYDYDPTGSRAETFVVDTPPPTVSGSLHIGHVFSYTQTDTVARYQRMRGRNIYYPIGWDDNGVPTERRVQNYYHVRCDPALPFEPDLTLEPANAKKRKDRPRVVSRRNFIELCHDVTRQDEVAFMELWQRVGLSVDWREEYATIDDHCRRLAQLSFRDLWEKGHLYSQFAPFMWDVDFQMAVAQAEVEDRPRPGAYYRIEFGVEGRDRSFVIATTRPELLGACVGVTAHPDDERYRSLFGKRAITPLFRAPVPIFPSDLADPEKGTGILMVCTFGDATDVHWWRSERLALRQLVGLDGRVLPVTYGEGAFESLDPPRANAAHAEVAGKRLGSARERIAELLRDPGASATGHAAPLQGEPETIEHAVRFYEKGDSPLEFVPTRQWFVRLLDKKAELIEKGEEIQWHPSHMMKRFRDWTEHLAYDWCISRQRYFGVSIPVWYPLDSAGEPDYDQPIVAEGDQLPVDPMTDLPRGYDEAQRNQPGGFVGESDIFDTWFTSSLTPQIGSHWLLNPERHRRLFPADLRPQSHEIIRTWAFYTIVKAHLHEASVPWHHVAISGWILDPDRKKMSKSKGNVVTPLPLIEQYSADAVRYWAASARLGVDTALDDKVFKVGKRLVTKLFNAAKFVLAQEAELQPVSCELDRAFVGELRALVAKASEAFESFDQAQALQETETFFWGRFTDTYLELTKARARGGDDISPADQGSAVAGLRLGLSILLRLFAPILPYITEETWSWVFAEESGAASIHRAPWPCAEELASVEGPADAESFELAIQALGAIHKAKAEASVSMGREVEHLVIAASAATLERLKPVLPDVLAATRCRQYDLVADEIEDGSIGARDARFGEANP